MDAAVSSSTDRSLQQNPAVRRRQMRQKVLNRIRKVNIKNKGLKSFYYFTYETVAVDGRNKSGTTASTYFFNGEPCEGDEQFLKQMKRSVFVTNVAAGTRKSEIKELFDRYGKIESIQLKSRNGETIVGRQHISPYSPIVAIVKFSKKEEAERACETKDGKFQAKLVDARSNYEKENCIRVENVDPKVTKMELREHYGACGTILGISLETNDGSLILTDKEYQKLSFVCCYIRFSRRSEAKVAREMHEYIFRERKLRVELAYQKHCDPNKLSNNVLRMFFQNVGNVVALDQIPHQHMGYVCYKNPLAPETIKRLNQRVYRNKRIHFEKLDIGNLVKKQQTKSGGDAMDIGTSSIQDGGAMTSTPNASASTSSGAGSVPKKAKTKNLQKKMANTSGAAAATPGAAPKKKMPRKSAGTATKAKATEKATKTAKEEMS
ncbi:uncharacterized protein LOC109412143 [Aedes albopictus]|uniref:RRM domain-containing protein n=1 Tax=Aedes albopictus TaxID=7160 RepID=A0ABM2A2J5_AEDAL|nr:uncharacterized protein LOC109412143 [Aedes albopictus]